ncbi:unnamed protein product [Porites evermanni]|uniref:receptor protein-tyrosine kinase n=1 Tax=Porites evermanni TaxID=104178 RepID=A0ABN8MHK1_9CNID|nr:unnamed protein product [Porites evermanni]
MNCYSLYGPPVLLLPVFDNLKSTTHIELLCTGGNIMKFVGWKKFIMDIITSFLFSCFLGISIAVADLPRIINITKPPLLTLGADVTLSCVAKGLSLLNVTWYKGGKVMSHHYGNRTSKAVLTLYNITREDWGEYVCVAKNSVGEDSKTVFIRILPSSPTILHTNTIARNKSWVLRWSAVYSEGHLVKTYTVWHQLWHIVKDNMTRKESWLRENITGFVYRKELAADTRYLFAVTAWNKWGESELEIDKILNISTKFTDAFTHQIERTTNLLATTKPQWTGTSTIAILMSNTKNEEKNDSIPIEALIAFSAFPVVVACAVWFVCYFRRNNAPWKNPSKRKGFSSPSHLNLTSELALESEDRRHSVIMSGSSWFIYGSTTTLTTTTNMDERSSSQPGIAEEFLFLKPVIPGPSNAAPTFACYDQPISQDVKVNNRDHVISAMNNHATVEVQEEITRDGKDNISQQVGTETSQQMFDSEGYLVPDDSDSVTRARKKMKPRTGPWLKKTLKKENKTFQFQNSTFYVPPERLHVSDGLEMAQHCASPRNPNQLFLTDLQTRTVHGSRNYENDPLQDTENALIHGSTDHPMVLGVSPYSHIYCNTSWEIPQDHLSLEEKIGGGEFGQVWRGKLYDVTSTGKWLVVAVKMLQANYSPLDQTDLLSELDLLKKLKPHPNVIRLLGCVTKDVVRCRGKGVFRPPLLILENAPYGDLLGYLRKRRGQNDDYDHLNRMEVPQKIAKQQLYEFATDIARGMEYIASHQLIHRDLAARNVLLGDKLRCKITDFGMARDLGLGDGIYARKSNGVMPLKWMAVESLTNRVSTTESDVWSYGIVLHEIFTLGGKPYDGMTAKEACFFVRSGQRMPRPSAISLELYELMLQCWNKEPSQRPKFSDIVIWMENSLQRV